jgi:hypothetical protein
MKNLQKGFVIPIIIAIVALLTLGGGAYIYTNTKVEAPVGLPEVIDNMPTTTVDNNIVGGDKDEHGCIGSTGYSWCAVKNKCLRVWEEKCDNTPINSGPGDKDGLVACTMDALQCPDGSYVGRSGPKCEFICPEVKENKKSQIFLETMRKSLSISNSVVPTVIYSYIGYGFGNGWAVQEIHSKYIRDRLTAGTGGKYTSQTGSGYTDGEIVCVIQGITKNVPDSPLRTTHDELVCFDIKSQTEDIPPSLGNSTLKISCNMDGCNTSGVKSTRSDFYLTHNGKQVKVLIDIETRLRLEMGGTEKLQKWADFYPIIDGPVQGMPFSATVYGDWIDGDTFKANWIKWTIG